MNERYVSQSWIPPKRKLQLPGGLELELGHRTALMGILNATPDSFSDGGQYETVAAALQQALMLIEHGADMIDIGGESTRPGAAAVSAELELKRVIPVIQAVREQTNVPISIDTYKPEVAKQALDAGAHIINDIWGLKKDRRMAEIAAEYRCPIIVMHNRQEPVYSDFLAEVVEDLQESIEIARQAGIADDQIILDPGIGFGKTLEHNLKLMRRLDAVVDLGYPVLLGTSRKSMIRHVLDVAVDDAVEGTAATVALGISQGCQIMRVHDVLQMRRVADMTDAIFKA